MKIQFCIICLLLCSCMERRGFWELTRDGEVISHGSYRYVLERVINGTRSNMDVYPQPWLSIDDISGTLTVRYADGSLWLKEIWDGDTLMRSEMWRENGTLQGLSELDSFTGCYTNRSYSIDGQLTREERVLNGRLLESKLWSDTGELYKHVTTGWPEDDTTFVRAYHPNGNIQRELIYSEDKWISLKEWTSDGLLFKDEKY